MEEAKKEFDIIAKRRFYLFPAVFLVLFSLISVVYFGFRLGIDFQGGTIWQLRFQKQFNLTELKKFLRGEFDFLEVNYDQKDNIFILRLPHLNTEKKTAVFEKLKQDFNGVEELAFQTIGPAVGQELKRKAIIAFSLVLLGISIYIAFAFRKASRPIKSWQYGLITLLTLFHDVAIPTGLLAFLGYFSGVEVDSNFVVALLVIMGFSVHDTIVVFDRIRENIVRDRGRSDFGKVVNQSVRQTLARSINTSATLLVVLLALYFAGPIALRYFVLILMVGVTLGTYSSIFIASPLLYELVRLKQS